MDYALNLLRRLQNLEQLKMYNKGVNIGILQAFYEVWIELGESRIHLHVCEWLYVIQDEFNVLKFCSMEKAYQVSFRIEEKLLRTQQTMKRALGYGRLQHKEKKVEEGESILVQWMILVEKDVMFIEDEVEKEEVEEANLKALNYLYVEYKAIWNLNVYKM